jgi:hypothetical protein
MAPRDEQYLTPPALDVRERAAVRMLQRAAAERAPERLRARIEAERAGRGRRPRRTIGHGALVAAVSAAAAVAIAFGLLAGTAASPSVSEAAALALRAPSSPAPAPDPAQPRLKLAVRLEGLYFPNWSASQGWRASGLRRDRLGSRAAVTVYYARGGMRVAYTIVAGPSLSQPAAQLAYLNGLELRVLRIGSRTVVTWRRAGHTCVLSATDVPLTALERLAAWRAPGLRE